MSRKIFLVLFLMLVLTGGFGLKANALSAYENKEALPGQKRTANLVEYLNQLYKFGIGAAGFLALVMITIGGFMYVVGSAGNVAKMGDAKAMIVDAIVGLVLALLAWLILFVVNPDLVKSGPGGIKATVDEKVEQSATNPSGATTSSVTDGGTTYTDFKLNQGSKITEEDIYDTECSKEGHYCEISYDECAKKGGYEVELSCQGAPSDKQFCCGI